MKYNFPLRFWVASCSVGVILAMFAVAGGVVGYQLRENTIEIPVQATASTWSESLCAATGPIDEEVEELYTLDAVTGDLQCAVLNPRTTLFAGVFRTNVLADLQIDATKKPNYLLLTGQVTFTGQSGNTRPGNSVVYVIDSTSGRFAAYGVPWQRALSTRGQMQTGQLRVLDSGTARNVMIRDS